VSLADLDGSGVARPDCLVFETVGGAGTVESIRVLRERYPSLPAVVLARDGDESLALTRGASV